MTDSQISLTSQEFKTLKKKSARTTVRRVIGWVLIALSFPFLAAVFLFGVLHLFQSAADTDEANLLMELNAALQEHAEENDGIFPRYLAELDGWEIETEYPGLLDPNNGTDIHSVSPDGTVTFIGVERPYEAWPPKNRSDYLPIDKSWARSYSLVTTNAGTFRVGYNSDSRDTFLCTRGITDYRIIGSDGVLQRGDNLCAAAG